MVIDKNYFLTRLQNGEDINTIGQSIADMMNEAVDAYAAEQKAAAAKAAELEKIQAKRDLVEELVEIIQELAILDGMDPNDFNDFEDEDLDDLADSLTAMFHTIAALKQMSVKPISVKATPASKAPKSDDEVLANFIKSLSF